MVLFFAVIVGLVLGFALGGSLTGFSLARFRYMPLLFISVLIQVLIFTPLMGQMDIIHRIGPYLYMASLTMSLIVLALNLRIPGLSIVLLGALLNAIVIFANVGYMPTHASTLEEAGRIHKVVQTDESIAAGETLTHTNSVIADDDTRLVFLGDVFAIPDGFPLSNVISIGDIFIALGAAVTIVLVMRLKPEEPHDTARAEVGDRQQVSG